MITIIIIKTIVVILGKQLLFALISLTKNVNIFREDYQTNFTTMTVI